MWRLCSRLLPLTILVGLLLSGCATKPAVSDYRIQIPTIGLPPKFHQCWAYNGMGQRQPTKCVTVLEEDWYALVAELKAACLANGQEPEQCQAILPPE